MMTVVDVETGKQVKHRVGTDFLLAGKATFTIQTPDKGHYTFRISRKEASNGYPEAFFVSLLTGSDNENDYTYLGMLDPFTGQVRTTRASEGRETSYPFRLLNRVLARIWTGDHAAIERHGYKVHHAGKCGRCGRTLTVPSSIETGIGPECVKHLRTY